MEQIQLELSLNEVNFILAALGELPAKNSMALINKLQQQATAQLQQKPMVVEAQSAN